MLVLDEMKIEMNKGIIFEGFTEPPIKFLPTYKYDNDYTRKMSLDYDETRRTSLNFLQVDPTPSLPWDTSKKQRVPSWTDRIIYTSENRHTRLRAYGHNSCNHEEYGSVQNITLSDHKPVYGKFSINVPSGTLKPKVL